MGLPGKGPPAHLGAVPLHLLTCVQSTDLLPTCHLIAPGSPPHFSPYGVEGRQRVQLWSAIPANPKHRGLRAEHHLGER